MAITYELEPLLVGIFTAFPIDRFVYGSPTSEAVRAPCIAWLARGSDGSKILVDTGPPVPTPLTTAFHAGLEVRPEHRIDAALRSANVDPSEVETVVFTHLHYDHCAHGEFLPNATFYVQGRELQYAVLPEPHQRGGYEIGFPGVIPSWVKVMDRIQAVNGDLEIAPGCIMLALPGHTPGSAGVVFATSAGRVAVAGDLINRRENWDAPGGGHAAPALFSSLDDCDRSLQTLDSAADVVLASHDFQEMVEPRPHSTE